MLKSVLFTCEICGRIYNNEEACTKCENGHVIPKSIGKYEYSCFSEIVEWPHRGTKKNPLTETTKRLVPESIQIKFSDGLYRTYKLYGSGEGFKATRTRRKQVKEESVCPAEDPMSKL